MGIIHPQKREIKGPWLLSLDNIESLNEIVIKFDNLLLQSYSNQIHFEIYQENKDKSKSEEELKRLIEERKKNRIYKREIICELISSDGTKMSDDNIKDLLKDNLLKNFSPAELEIKINHGSYSTNSFDLRISTSRYDGQLDYKINCFDTNVESEIRYDIDKWIDKFRPNKILQLWSNYGGVISFSLWIPILLLGFYSFSTDYASYKEVIQQQSNSLINEGINNTNRDSAIQLILKSTADYVPQNFIASQKERNPTWKRLFYLSLFIYLLSFVRPKTTIGLGKRKQLFHFYKFWIKFVTVTLPTVLVLTPFWKVLTGWIYN